MNTKIYVLTFISYAIFTLARQPLVLYKSYNTTLTNVQLGLIDTSFLLFYTIGSIVNGRAGDFFDSKKLLVFGLLLSGMSCILLGLALHSFIYLLIMNGIAGFFQSSGWPAVMGLIGNDISGLKMGIWNIHGAVGNIVGKVLISSLFETVGIINTFIITGCICLFVSVIQHKLLPEQEIKESNKEEGVILSLCDIFNKIPELTLYCICFFCVKFSVYCLMMWLPLYVSSLNYSSYEANLISSFYDIGSIVSSVITGYMYDKYRKPAIICGVNLAISIPLLFIYSYCKNIVIGLQLLLIFTIGITTNVAYLLITGKISSELSMKLPEAKSEVIGILNASGSAGATLQGITIGLLGGNNWNLVFYTLISCCGLSIVSISNLIYKEIN